MKRMKRSHVGTQFPLTSVFFSSRGCSRPSTTPRALCITGSLMASSAVIGWRILFILLGCTMVATLGYTLATDGSPFRRELLSRYSLFSDVRFSLCLLSFRVLLRLATCPPSPLPPSTYRIELL